MRPVSYDSACWDRFNAGTRMARLSRAFSSVALHPGSGSDHAGYLIGSRRPTSLDLRGLDIGAQFFSTIPANPLLLSTMTTLCRLCRLPLGRIVASLVLLAVPAVSHARARPAGVNVTADRNREPCVRAGPLAIPVSCPERWTESVQVLCRAARIGSRFYGARAWEGCSVATRHAAGTVLAECTSRSVRSRRDPRRLHVATFRDGYLRGCGYRASSTPSPPGRFVLTQLATRRGAVVDNSSQVLDGVYRLSRPHHVLVPRVAVYPRSCFWARVWCMSTPKARHACYLPIARQPHTLRGVRFTPHSGPSFFVRA